METREWASFFFLSSQSNPQTYIHTLPQVSHVRLLCLNQLCHDESGDEHRPHRKIRYTSTASSLNISELLNFYNLWVKRKWKRTLFGVLTCASLHLIREQRLAAWPLTLEPWLGWYPTGGLYSATEKFKKTDEQSDPERERDLWPVNVVGLWTDRLVGVGRYPQSLLQAAAVLVHAQREVSVAFVHCRHPLFDLSGVTVAFFTEAISELDQELDTLFSLLKERRQLDAH